MFPGLQSDFEHLMFFLVMLILLAVSGCGVSYLTTSILKTFYISHISVILVFVVMMVRSLCVNHCQQNDTCLFTFRCLPVWSSTWRLCPIGSRASNMSVLSTTEFRSVLSHSLLSHCYKYTLCSRQLKWTFETLTFWPGSTLKRTSVFNCRDYQWMSLWAWTCVVRRQSIKHVLA